MYIHDKMFVSYVYRTHIHSQMLSGAMVEAADAPTPPQSAGADGGAGGSGSSGSSSSGSSGSSSSKILREQ